VWDHIGRISGIVLGLLLTAVLCLLMAAGYSAAGFLLLLVLGGMVMIAVGGRIHGR
jgi:fucose permease